MLRVTGLVLVVVALTGCIEFEKQTILLRLDAEKDVAHLRLIYHGIYAGDSELDDALKDLRDVAEGGNRFFLLDNWPLEVDLSKPAKDEKDNPNVALLRPHTTVTNGSFFLDADGKLCGWQDIEFRNASKILGNYNRLIGAAVIMGKVDALDDADDDTLAGNRALALGGHAWVRLDAKGAHFEFAISPADAARLKRGLLESIVKEAREGSGEEDEALAAPDDGKDGDEDGDEGDDDEDEKEGDDDEKEGEPEKDEITGLEAIIRFFSVNPINWIHRGSRAQVSFAADQHGVVRVEFTNKGRYVPNLLESAKDGEKPPELPRKIDREMTVEKLVEGFGK